MKTQFLTRFSMMLAFTIAISGCTKDFLEKPTPPKPKVGVETDSLEASFIATPLSSANAAGWTAMDYIKVELNDLSKQHLYDEDGCLNLTGTYNGLADFNSGNPSSLTLRAAYDNEFLYILAEWEDDDVDASQKTWLYNGPSDALKPGESSAGWTSQRNDDNIAFAFDLNDATTSAGMFSNVGCAASCHSSGGKNVMSPESGSVDIWNWSLALSEPFGYALDMKADAAGLDEDAGQKSFERNAVDPSDSRSGPKYEWDGVSQTVNQSLGTGALLDAGLFLLNKTPFLGDASRGQIIYQYDSIGCIGCHGPGGNGSGTHDAAPAFTRVEFSRTYSRSAIFDHANGNTHDGQGRWASLTDAQRNDVVAYIKGLAGVPGYYLTEPVPGESINDISCNSNAAIARIDPAADHGAYKVMFKRKLDTGNADDAVFDPSSGKDYVFGVALMDNDGKNHIGSLMEHLIFKDK